MAPELSDVAGKITGWMLERYKKEILEVLESEDQFRVLIRQCAEKLNTPLFSSSSYSAPSPSMISGSLPPPPGQLLADGEFSDEEDSALPSSRPGISPPPSQMSASAVHLLKHRSEADEEVVDTPCSPDIPFLA